MRNRMKSISVVVLVVVVATGCGATSATSGLPSDKDRALIGAWHYENADGYEGMTEELLISLDDGQWSVSDTVFENGKQTMSFQCGDIVVRNGTIGFKLFEKLGYTDMSGSIKGDTLHFDTKFRSSRKTRDYKRAQPLP